jgi:hypothetical protein
VAASAKTGEHEGLHQLAAWCLGGDVHGASSAEHEPMSDGVLALSDAWLPKERLAYQVFWLMPAAYSKAHGPSSLLDFANAARLGPIDEALDICGRIAKLTGFYAAKTDLVRCWLENDGRIDSVGALAILSRTMPRGSGRRLV